MSISVRPPTPSLRFPLLTSLPPPFLFFSICPPRPIPLHFSDLPPFPFPHFSLLFAFSLFIYSFLPSLLPTPTSLLLAISPLRRTPSLPPSARPESQLGGKGFPSCSPARPLHTIDNSCCKVPRRLRSARRRSSSLGLMRGEQLLLGKCSRESYPKVMAAGRRTVYGERDDIIKGDARDRSGRTSGLSIVHPRWLPSSQLKKKGGGSDGNFFLAIVSSMFSSTRLSVCLCRLREISLSCRLGPYRSSSHQV